MKRVSEFQVSPLILIAFCLSCFMNIQRFSEYMLKSSKCGPQASKMNIVQAKKYPHFDDFFYRPKMSEISNLLSHFNAMCDNIRVKSAEGYNLLSAFENLLRRKQPLCIFKVVKKR